jgi:hypothetical protein
VDRNLTIPLLVGVPFYGEEGVFKILMFLDNDIETLRKDGIFMSSGKKYRTPQYDKKSK